MSETTKALFKDALYQVLDNKVFRLLAILILVMVLPTFLIAAKPEKLSLLFGLYEYSYEDVFRYLPIPYTGAEDANARVIQLVQGLLVDQIAGIFGLIFAIAATAFFVPRMVEKGAADTVFSKPVSRSALLLSRYVAGLLFVAILTAVLVVGMHIGLLLNSGYSDAGFLWSIPVMVYKYAILHAFSLLIAVWTRSSVAAILTTLMFFAFNGCVHQGWEVKEYGSTQHKIDFAAGETNEGDDPGSFLRGLVVVLDVLHYTLPKTSDAAVIAKKLRTTLAERGLALKDETSGLKINVAPEGFSKQEVNASDLPTIALWTQQDGIGRITLKRWASSRNGRRQAFKDLDAKLSEMGIRDVKTDRDRILDMRAEVRSWMEPRGDLRVERSTLFFNGEKFLFSLEYELPEGSSEDSELHSKIQAFQYSFEQGGLGSRSSGMFFEQRAAWSGELKYNLWFSVGSTLAFIALLLGLSTWKLSRIDF